LKAYLVSNMAIAEEACRLYEKRFRIETFFADQKSRGFHIHQSHISDVQRLSRLLIAACLAYIWIIYLGSVCEKDQWSPIVHRRKRCDLRLLYLAPCGRTFLVHHVPGSLTPRPQTHNPVSASCIRGFSPSPFARVSGGIPRRGP
jgi:hypothetical protein